MPRFNLALIPTEPKIQKLFSSLSLSFFGDKQDGYILTDGALAHITLCHFNAKMEQDARDAFHSFDNKQSLTLAIEQFRLKKGTDEHAGYFWAEYLIEKNPALIEMQRNCFDHLKKRGFDARTPVESYSPHITLARVRCSVQRLPSLEDVPCKDAIAFRPAIGFSTNTGVLSKELQ